jgi:mannose-6-phosphate isomerase-like protein (cupin superfamily)
MSHENNIVKKPWGYEYLMYENDKVALWFLFIDKNESTSMHCHPNKTTGLTLLEGEVNVSFLSDVKNLKPFSKIMIRKGLFHSTRAISNSGAFVLEIETPVDKHDLVRFKDSYGREGKPYEDSTFEYLKENDCIWIENPTAGNSNDYKVGNVIIKVINIENIDFFHTINDDKNVMFLDGGIVAEYGTNVAGPGDIVAASVLKELTTVFNSIKDDTIIMLMEKND